MTIDYKLIDTVFSEEYHIKYTPFTLKNLFTEYKQELEALRRDCEISITPLSSDIFVKSMNKLIQDTNNYIMKVNIVLEMVKDEIEPKIS